MAQLALYGIGMEMYLLLRKSTKYPEITDKNKGYRPKLGI
jgi:hypothetical protein